MQSNTNKIIRRRMRAINKEFSRKEETQRQKSNDTVMESNESEVKDNQLFVVEISSAFHQILVSVNAIENACLCPVFNTF